MRKLLSLLLLALPMWAAPVVSNVTASYISHSDVLITWNTDVPYQTLKVMFAASPAACTTGITQPNPDHSGSGSSYPTTFTMIVGGLNSNTLYNICPMGSNDGGATWSTPVPVQVQTLPLPSVHPAIPIAPQIINTDRPDTTGFTVRTMGSSCLEVATGKSLVTVIQEQLWDQLNHGAVIKIPAGTICSPATLTFDALAADAVQFQPTAVTIGSPGTITVTGHGLTEGQEVIFGKQYGSSSSFPSSTSCEFGEGLLEGEAFYAHPTGVNTFQVYCPDKTTLMAFTTQGSVTNYFAYVSIPRKVKPIIIRTATPDSDLPPEHVRITPQWASKLAILQNPISNLNTANNWIIFGDIDHNDQRMVGNIRFIGIEFTTADAPAAHNSSNPPPWVRQITQNNWNTDITYDQCYWHYLDHPNRIGGTADGLPFVWTGNRMSIVDSYFDNIAYFRSNYNGLTATLVDATHATVAAGTFYDGTNALSLPSTETITFSGTPTTNTNGNVYFNRLNSNQFTVSTPAGVTATCSPNACINATSSTGSGVCNYSDDWPKGSYGEMTVDPIGCLNWTGSSLTSFGNADPQSDAWSSSDALNFMNAPDGSGPWKFVNNYIEGVGLIWHHDDAAGAVPFPLPGSNPQWIRGDYDYEMNHFRMPFRYMANHPEGNHLSYFHRQTLEWKGGRRIRLYGNIFDGGMAQVDRVSSAGPTFTSVNSLGITDVDMKNNTIMHTPNGVQGVLSTINTAPLPPPANRFRFQNNLIWDMNMSGPEHNQGCESGTGTLGNYWLPGGGVFCGAGWNIEGPSGLEDVIIDHNTFVGGNGGAPSIFRTLGPYTEGMFLTNNFFYVWNVTQGVSQEGGMNPLGCGGLTGKAAADCLFIGNGGYTMANNVLQSGDMTQTQLQTAWPTLPNIFPASQDLSTNGWFKYSQTFPNDFHLRNDSAFITAATDHKAVGADIDALDRAQGNTKLIGVPPASLTTTAASVAFIAPNTQACPVDVATSPWPIDASTAIPAFTRYPDSGTAAGPRSVALGPLTTGTTYYYKVECSHSEIVSGKDTLTGVFKTR